jgi:hypothetical protein
MIAPETLEGVESYSANNALRVAFAFANKSVPNSPRVPSGDCNHAELGPGVAHDRNRTGSPRAENERELNATAQSQKLDESIAETMNEKFHDIFVMNVTSNGQHSAYP